MPLLLLSAFLAGSAHAGELVVDVKVPARLVVDGELVAEVYKDGVLRLPWPEGGHHLVVTVNGEPKSLDVTAGTDPVVLLVGRSGVTIGAAAAPAAVPAVDANGNAEVRFRTVGTERLLVQIDNQRVAIAPGRGVLLPLPLGEHPMSVRSSDGTSVFARGVLTVGGGHDLVVQVTEGLMPETSGDGVAFSPGSP